MRLRVTAVAVVVGVLVPVGLRAQVPWEAPLLVSSASPPGLSIVVADPGAGPGLIALWQGRDGPVRLGYRVGLAEAGRDDVAVFGGVDASGLVTAHSVNFPLDVVWVTGVGLGVSDGALLTVPVGVSFGRVVRDENIRVHPYLTPRLVVDAYLGDGENRDDVDLGIALDIGLDLAFESNWMIRMAAAFGDREAVAIGLAFPFAF